MYNILWGRIIPFPLGIARSYVTSILNVLRKRQTAVQSHDNISHSRQHHPRVQMSPHLSALVIVSFTVAILVGTEWRLSVVLACVPLMVMT